MTITPEHLAALKAGREASRMARKQKSVNPLCEKERQELKKVSEYLSPAVGVFERAFSGKSLAAAVKARCIQCSCYSKPEITKCRVTDCALFRYRPYQGGATNGDNDAG
jgi:hypothetical protein